MRGIESATGGADISRAGKDILTTDVWEAQGAIRLTRQYPDPEPINSAGLDQLVHDGTRLAIPFDELCTNPCVQGEFETMIWDKPLETLRKILRIIHRELPKVRAFLSRQMSSYSLEEMIQRLLGIVEKALARAIRVEAQRERLVALSN